MADIQSGRSEPLVPGFQVLDYDISRDGKQVVMWTTDSEGKSRLWVAPFDRSSPPALIPNVEGSEPKFGPGGEIFFCHLEGTSLFVYRVHPDGTGLRKAFAEPVLLMHAVSPDGRWVFAWAPLPGNGSSCQAFPLDGGRPIPFGPDFTFLTGSLDGRSLFTSSHRYSYFIPLPPGAVLPPIPAGGFHSDEGIARLPGVRRIDSPVVVPGPSDEVYAFHHGTVQRNLYRIPVP
jgi:hypothetical protein